MSWTGGVRDCQRQEYTAVRLVRPAAMLHGNHVLSNSMLLYNKLSRILPVAFARRLRAALNPDDRSIMQPLKVLDPLSPL